LPASTGPLLPLLIDPARPRGRQLELQLRELIRSGGLPSGSPLPSTRALAQDLGVSRGLVVSAYAQLSAEGYLLLHRGARPVVAPVTGLHSRGPRAGGRDVPIAEARFNLRPDLPDLALFPRADWLRATKGALNRALDADLAYGEPFGALALREVLAPFLVRTRGVVVEPARLGITNGSTHALAALGRVLHTHGHRRVAVEEPCHRWRRAALEGAGLETVGIPVDSNGVMVSELEASGIAVVVVSTDHSFPLGVVMSPERRRELVAWVGGRDERLVIEHDYDAHFSYDRPAASALQSLAPDRFAYVGTASALLAPTLRVGWAALPEALVVDVAGELARMSIASSRITQHALAEFIERGYLDRHVRRARAAYRRRLDIVRSALPTTGSGAGLYVRVPLPVGANEQAVLGDLWSRGFALDGVNQNAIGTHEPALVIGFAASSEPSLAEALSSLRGVVARRPARSRR
jgi:GntR family transcriptional regulator/MocR family aminotransferase